MQFWTEYFVYAEIHPLPNESTSITSLLLVVEHNFYFFVKVYGFKLIFAGHQNVFSIDF